MGFPKELPQNEIQTTSSRIWTRVADSISNDVNCDDKHAAYNIRIIPLKDFVSLFYQLFSGTPACPYINKLES